MTRWSSKECDYGKTWSLSCMKAKADILDIGLK